MYEKIYEVVETKAGQGIRLKAGYLRTEEVNQLITVLKLVGARFVTRLNCWDIHPDAVERFTATLWLLGRKVEARVEIGYNPVKERNRIVAARNSARQAAKAFKALVFKTRGSHCEACGDGAQVHHRIVPKHICNTDELAYFVVLCRSCQKRVRLHFNQCIAEELSNRDAGWFVDKAAEGITKIIDDDSE